MILGNTSLTDHKTYMQGVHPGFKTQGRCHRKSKTQMSVDTWKEVMPSKMKKDFERSVKSNSVASNKHNQMLLWKPALHIIDLYPIKGRNIDWPEGVYLLSILQWVRFSIDGNNVLWSRGWGIWTDPYQCNANNKSVNVLLLQRKSIKAIYIQLLLRISICFVNVYQYKHK